MSSLVSYALNGNVATVTLDDGKANALSPDMQAAINDALDQASLAAGSGEVKALVVAGDRKSVV